MSENNMNEEQVQACGMVIFFGILALIMSILISYNMDIPNCTSFRRTITVILGIVLGTPLGAIGGMIGNVLRQAAHPDAFLTRGGMYEILMTKLFWAIGPQLIGTGIGSLAGAGGAGLLLSKYFFT